MARDLKARILALIGPRKSERFNLDDEDVIDDFIVEGLRELGETVPFVIEVGSFTLDSTSRIDVGPLGSTSGRRLDVLDVWLDVPGGVPREIPKQKSVLRNDVYIRSSGWSLTQNFVGLATASPYYNSGSSNTFRVRFRAIPTEAEIAANPTFMRAASLFGAANAIEEIGAASIRENIIRLEGVPDIRDNTKGLNEEAEMMRARARALVGDFQAILFL